MVDREINRTMDSGVDLELSRLSVSSAKFRETTLGRQDKEIERLTKANFDLQLQVFAWEEKMVEVCGSTELKKKSNTRFVTLMEEKQRELEEKDSYLVKARDIIYTLVARNEINLGNQHGDDGDSALACLGEDAADIMKLLCDAECKPAACDDGINRSDFAKERERSERLEKENAELSESLESATKDHKELLDKYQSVEFQIAAMKAEQTELESRIESLTRNAESAHTLQQKVDELNERLSDERHQKTQSQKIFLQEKTQLQAEFERKLADAEKASTLRIEELEEIHSKYASESAQWESKLKSELLKERETAGCLRATIQEQQTKLEADSKHMLQLQTQLDSANSSADMLKDKQKELEQEADQTRMQLQRVSENLSARNHEAEASAVEIREAERTISELHIELKQEKCRMEKAREDLKSLECQCIEYKREIDALTSREKCISADELNLKQQVQSLTVELQTVKDEKEALETSLCRTKETNVQLEEEADAGLETGQLLDDEVRKLWAQLVESDSNGAFWQHEAGRAEKETAKWKEIAEAMETEVDTVRGERDQDAEMHQQEVNRLHEDQRQLQTAFERESAALRRQRRELKERLRELTEQLHDTHSEFQKVCEERSEIVSKYGQLENDFRKSQQLAEAGITDPSGAAQEEQQNLQDLVTRLGNELKEMKRQEHAKSNELDQLTRERDELLCIQVRLEAQIKDLQSEIEAQEHRFAAEETSLKNVVEVKLRVEDDGWLGSDAVASSGVAPRKGKLQDVSNMYTSNEREVSQTSKYWRHVVYRQLEKSRKLNNQLGEYIDLHQKVLLHGLPENTSEA